VKKILVTGSKGFIGSLLTESLRKSGYETYGLDIIKSEKEINYFSCDVTSSEIDSILQEIRPNIIVHTAAQIRVDASILDPEEDLQVNGFGTLNLIRAALNSNVENFCYINSGGAIYDQTKSLPISEFGDVRPLSPYGLSKYLGEEYLRILSTGTPMRWSSLALSNCYGPLKMHKKGVIYEITNNILLNRPTSIYGANTTRDFIHIEDVIRAIQCAITLPSMCRVNISSQTETSLIRIYDLISKFLHCEERPIVLEPRQGEILRSSLSNGSAFDFWGWKPQIDIDDGIKALMLEINKDSKDEF